MIDIDITNIEDDLDSLNGVFDNIDFNKIHEILIEEGTAKGLNLWGKLDLEITAFEVAEHNFKNRGEDLSAIERIILVIAVIKCNYGISIQTTKLIHYARTTIVLSVIREIDIQKPIQELNKIDIQLTSFIEYNHLSALYEHEKFPEYLIQEGREHLNRISLKYGNHTPVENVDYSTVESEDIIDFPVDLFLKKDNYLLFVFFIENYAIAKRPVDLSHIFRWMEEEQLIAKRSGMKYMKYSVENNLVLGKFICLSF